MNYLLNGNNHVSLKINFLTKNTTIDEDKDVINLMSRTLKKTFGDLFQILTTFCVNNTNFPKEQYGSNSGDYILFANHDLTASIIFHYMLIFLNQDTISSRCGMVDQYNDTVFFTKQNIGNMMPGDRVKKMDDLFQSIKYNINKINEDNITEITNNILLIIDDLKILLSALNTRRGGVRRKKTKRERNKRTKKKIKKNSKKKSKQRKSRKKKNMKKHMGGATSMYEYRIKKPGHTTTRKTNRRNYDKKYSRFTKKFIDVNVNASRTAALKSTYGIGKREYTRKLEKKISSDFLLKQRKQQIQYHIEKCKRIIYLFDDLVTYLDIFNKKINTQSEILYERNIENLFMNNSKMYIKTIKKHGDSQRPKSLREIKTLYNVVNTFDYNIFKDTIYNIESHILRHDPRCIC